MNQDAWKPEQYNKFKSQRAQPFWDLWHLVQTQGIRTVVDLGCGTGELTKELEAHLPAADILGIDSSAAMLKDSSKLTSPRLKFDQQDIANFSPPKKFDLVFSNATLQWLPEHEVLFPKVFNWVADGGQVAIQIPFNFDHPSHQIAHELAQNFVPLKGHVPPSRKALPLERYSEMLYRAGFTEQKCFIQVYPHAMASGQDVIEWTKGTLLTSYQKELSEKDFNDFLALYRKTLMAKIGEGPYLYTFKRLLMWGKR